MHIIDTIFNDSFYMVYVISDMVEYKEMNDKYWRPDSNIMNYTISRWKLWLHSFHLEIGTYLFEMAMYISFLRAMALYVTQEQM